MFTILGQIELSFDEIKIISTLYLKRSEHLFSKLVDSPVAEVERAIVYHQSIRMFQSNASLNFFFFFEKLRMIRNKIFISFNFVHFLRIE